VLHCLTPKLAEVPTKTAWRTKKPTEYC